MKLFDIKIQDIKSEERKQFYSTYPLTPTWEKCIIRMNKIIESNDSIEKKIQQVIALNMFYPVRDDKQIKQDIDFKTNLLYKSLEVCKLKDKEKLMVLEIGGGLGNFIEMFKKEKPKSKFVMVDIYESLFFSYHYLSKIFKDKVKLISTNDDLVDILVDDNLVDIFSEYDILLIPANVFKDCRILQKYKFDMFFNMRSFGEINNKTLSHYYDILFNMLDIRYFIFHNKFFNICDKHIDHHRLIENGSFCMIDKGTVLHFELHKQLGGLFQQELFLILDSKKENKYDTGIMEHVSDCLWYKNFKPFPNRINSYLNFIDEDMSINGTFFRLWNVCRSYDDAVAYDMLIKYLYLLGRGWMFDEYYYFIDKYRSIFGVRYVFLKDRLRGVQKMLCFLHLNYVDDKTRYVYKKIMRSKT